MVEGVGVPYEHYRIYVWFNPIDKHDRSPDEMMDTLTPIRINKDLRQLWWGTNDEHTVATLNLDHVAYYEVRHLTQEETLDQ